MKSRTTLPATIDFAGIVDRASLRALVEADLGPPDRGRKWRCPFHDDHSPSMALSPDGRRFKCWSARCGASGTALDWLMMREDLSIVEAARKLDPSLGPETKPRRAARRVPITPPPRKVAPPAPWKDEAWQFAADALICEAEAALWSAEGRPARNWLRRRGLDDSTIRRFRLGFVPAFLEGPPLDALADASGPRPIKIPRGIVMPWLCPGSWYSTTPDPSGADALPRWVGANVRRLMPDLDEPTPKNRKCLAFAGSARGFSYPMDVLATQSALPALIVEGELDALIAWQECAHLVNVLTIGGAEQAPQEDAVEDLGLCPWWLVATDHDQAGDRAAQRFVALDPHKARRAYLPAGKDLGEFHQSGGDVAAWITLELSRLDPRSLIA